MCGLSRGITLTDVNAFATHNHKFVQTPFSVIIPVFNKEKFIRATLESALNQDYEEYEIIIVNDGSTDESIKKIEDIKSKKLQIINQPNQGVSATRNAGIKEATHSYICLLDGDDIWLPNHLSTLNELIQKFPLASLFGTNFKIINIHNREIKKIYKLDLNPPSSVANAYIENYFETAYRHKSSPLTSSNACFNKNIIKDIGEFAVGENFTEDLDFWVRASLNYKIAFTNRITVHILQNKEGASTSIQERELVVVKTLRNYLNTNKMPKNIEKDAKKLMNYYHYFLLHNMVLANKKNKFYFKMLFKHDPIQSEPLRFLRYFMYSLLPHFLVLRLIKTINHLRKIMN